ncbi:O-antigen ligase family protein [Thiomicrorhabdus sp.]|uniref:O-antigen ligase family protein n=1 Tax=Thiomicrorhabdus sp. TaxID=2039724 RepID=UPI0035669ADD
MFQKKTLSIGLFLLVSIFYMSLFSVPNIGGQSGIVTPSNLGVYIGLTGFLFWMVFYSISSGRVLFSRLPAIFLLCVLLLLLVGSFKTTDWIEFKYQALAMLFGLSFVIGLLQIEWKQNHWFWFFYALCILGFMQGLIALDQRFDRFGVLYVFTEYYPLIIKSSGYLGSLQQKNMFASFIAFTEVLSLFLVSQKRFSSLSVWLKIPIYLFVAMGAFLVINSGSRSGLLGLILGLIFVVWAIRDQLVKESKDIWIWLFVAIFGVVIGLIVPVLGSSVNDKFANVVFGTDVRWFLYQTGWSIFQDNIWFGIGIGNYPKVFQEYVSVHNLWHDPRIVGFDIYRVTHPHNELLFWFIQTGLVGMLGVVLSFLGLLVNWYRQGGKHLLIQFGLLSPLVVQALVSYPFSLSATHYLLTLFLLFYGTHLKTYKFSFNLYGAVKVVIVMGALVLVLIFWRYGYQSAWSAFEVYYFKNRLFFYKQFPEQEKVGYFQYASGNELYLDLVRDNMQNLFHNAVRDSNYYDLRQYLLWYRQQDEVPEDYKNYASQAEYLLKNSDKQRLSE